MIKWYCCESDIISFAQVSSEKEKSFCEIFFFRDHFASFLFTCEKCENFSLFSRNFAQSVSRNICEIENAKILRKNLHPCFSFTFLNYQQLMYTRNFLFKSSNVTFESNMSLKVTRKNKYNFICSEIPRVEPTSLPEHVYRLIKSLKT